MTRRAMVFGGLAAPAILGGTRRNRLFMTGSQSLYVVYVEAQGAHIC